MNKPDAVTLITPTNFKEIVFPLASDNLLYVGRATKAKLARFGILTIWDIGVRVSDSCPADTPTQTNFFTTEQEKIRKEQLDFMIDEIRYRFGHFSINRAIEHLDKDLTAFNPSEENVIHPCN